MLFKTLNDVIVLCVLFHVPVRYIYAFEASSWNVLKRSEAEREAVLEAESPFLACEEQQLRTTPGTYTYFSEGQKKLCSLYIAAPTDHVVEMEFSFFQVDCVDDGAVALLDGWELDFEIFPNAEDHSDPMSRRYIAFCGENRPRNIYMAKQNVAQVQFVVPLIGEGFSVKVSFKLNQKPCNMMLLNNHYDKLTIRNYGLQRNCTVMSLYPQRVQFLYVNIGEMDRDALLYDNRMEPELGLRTKCNGGAGEDSVQLYQGSGVGAAAMRMVLGFCGVRQSRAPRAIRLRCHSSALRLESSGQYFNIVKFAVLPALEMDGIMC